MTPFRLALEWFLNPDHVPFLVAKHFGWFAAEGIALELIEPKEHIDAASALKAGTVDAAITEPLHLVEDVAAGHALQGFARFLHTNGGVMYVKGNGIERPRDMAGKRVQYPGAPGPGGRAIVATMIEADGGGYDPDALQPVNRGFHHTDALLEDAADVATLAFYNFEVVEARHRGADADFFALKDWGVPDFCQLILITQAERLAEETERFQTVVRVLRRAVDFAKQNADEARRIYAIESGQPLDGVLAEIYAATTPCFTHDFSMAPAYYTQLGTWMQRTGQINAAPGNVWTNALAL